MAVTEIVLNGKRASIGGGSGGIVNWEDINGRPDLSSVSSIKVQPAILSAGFWIDGQQEIPIQGVSADETQQLILLKPKYLSQQLFDAAVIKIVGQSENNITVKADSVPTEDVSVIFYILGAAEVKEEYVGTFEWWSPKMTADNAPAPYVASASSVYHIGSEYHPAYRAFDGVATVDVYATGGIWSSANNVGSAYIQFDFGALSVIKGLKINPQYADPNNPRISCPDRCYVSGSADGETWDVIAEFNNIAWAGIEGYTEFEFENPVRYRYFRIGAKDITPEESFLGRLSYGDIQFLTIQQGGAS